MPGDRIISANDTVIAGKKMVNSQIIKVLRGPKGSVVNLKVKRGPELIDFTLTRDDIPVYSVDETFMADRRRATYASPALPKTPRAKCAAPWRNCAPKE